jgi:hypothetical protein
MGFLKTVSIPIVSPIGFFQTVCGDLTNHRLCVSASGRFYQRVIFSGTEVREHQLLI